MRPFAFDSSGCLLVYLWGSSGSDRDYVACAPEALVPIQCDNSQRPAWPANRAPTRGVGEPRSPPIPRFHFGSSHGQQVIGIDKLKVVAGRASLPAHSISHVPLENVLGDRCVGAGSTSGLWEFCIRHQCLSNRLHDQVMPP